MHKSLTSPSVSPTIQSTNSQATIHGGEANAAWESAAQCSVTCEFADKFWGNKCTECTFPEAGAELEPNLQPSLNGGDSPGC